MIIITILLIVLCTINTIILGREIIGLKFKLQEAYDRLNSRDEEEDKNIAFTIEGMYSTFLKSSRMSYKDYLKELEIYGVIDRVMYDKLIELHSEL